MHKTMIKHKQLEVRKARYEQQILTHYMVSYYVGPFIFKELNLWYFYF